MALKEEAQAAFGGVLSLGEGVDDLVELRGSLDLEVALVVLLVDNADLDLLSLLSLIVHGASVRQGFVASLGVGRVWRIILGSVGSVRHRGDQAFECVMWECSGSATEVQCVVACGK